MRQGDGEGGRAAAALGGQLSAQGACQLFGETKPETVAIGLLTAREKAFKNVRQVA